MAPLSVIPGRIRLESHELIGKRHGCMSLTNKINSVKGIIKTDINPRTGRILIIFDDSQIIAADLITKVKEFLNAMAVEPFAGNMLSEIQDTNRNNKVISNAFIHAAIDIAGHALLPKPLRFLFPLAVNSLIKSL